MTLNFIRWDPGRKLNRERIFGLTRKRKLIEYFLLIAILLFGALLPAYSTKSAFHQLPGASGEPLTLKPEEVAKLINECGARTTQMTGRLYNYTFNETDHEYVIDKKNRVKSEQSKVFEVYPVTAGGRNRWIRVQIAENGVPLSAERIAGERRRAARQTMELEQQANTGQASRINVSYKPRFSSYGIKVEKHSGLSRTIWFINPTDFLVSHDFYAPQRVSFAAREAVLLNFRPRSGYLYDKTNVPFPDGVEDYGRAMSQLGGRIWIDARDKVIVRLEAKPSRELSDAGSSNTTPDANAAIWFELTRLPNGTWAPSVYRYSSYGREDVFWKTPMSRLRRYSDFKFFKTTVDVEKIEVPPEKR
jgi:hypothetical protein